MPNNCLFEDDLVLIRIIHQYRSPTKGVRNGLRIKDPLSKYVLISYVVTCSKYIPCMTLCTINLKTLTPKQIYVRLSHLLFLINRITIAIRVQVGIIINQGFKYLVVFNRGKYKNDAYIKNVIDG